MTYGVCPSTVPNQLFVFSFLLMPFVLKNVMSDYVYVL